MYRYWDGNMLITFQKQQEDQCGENIMRRSIAKDRKFDEARSLGTCRPWQEVLDQLLNVLKKHLEDFKQKNDIWFLLWKVYPDTMLKMDGEGKVSQKILLYGHSWNTSSSACNIKLRSQGVSDLFSILNDPLWYSYFFSKDQISKFMYSESIPIRFTEANPKSNIFLGFSIIVVTGPLP